MTEPALEPEDLSRFLVERVNAGDVDGVVALYDEDAVLVLPDGNRAVGRDAIRASFEPLVASRARLTLGRQRPTVRYGDLALTSTLLDGGGVTVEVARRRADGTWRWVLDDPDVTVARHGETA